MQMHRADAAANGANHASVTASAAIRFAHFPLPFEHCSARAHRLAKAHAGSSTRSNGASERQPQSAYSQAQRALWAPLTLIVRHRRPRRRRRYSGAPLWRRRANQASRDAAAGCSTSTCDVQMMRALLSEQISHAAQQRGGKLSAVDGRRMTECGTRLPRAAIIEGTQ